MKKFFKILMVFALLGGAALSCTKDYSKEIQDVQKQSQELQALITSLQNALNSTNATVAQLSKDLTGLTQEHKKDIETLTKRAGEIEAKITELKGQVDINAKDIEDLQRIVDDINLTLKGLRDDIDQNAEDIAKNAEEIAANKGRIEANLDQINKLWIQIEDLQTAIDRLSARLTNIVAAPAMDEEVQTIVLGDTTRTIIHMDFVVTPVSAAQAIVDKYGEDEKLKLTYTLYNGLDRAQTKAKEEEEEELYSVTAIPYLVDLASDGVISVTAVCDNEIVKPTGEKKLYVTLTVAGEDEAGAFERVSDPVKPIYSKTPIDIFKGIKWFKGDKAVKDRTEDEFNISDVIYDTKVGEGKNEFSDSVYVVGQRLVIIAPDYDWKELPKSNEDILESYGLTLKWEFTQGQALTLEETAELFDLPIDMLTPHFTAGGDKKAFAKSDYAPIEWKDMKDINDDTTHDYAPIEWEDAKLVDLNDSTVFVATGDTTSLKLGLAVALKGTEPEQAEYVGAFTQLSSNWIALGGQKITEGEIGSCNINYFQRICKHVTEQKAADPLHASFAFNAGKHKGKGASQSDTTFSSVKWLSSTPTTNFDSARKLYIYKVKDGKITADKNGAGYIYPSFSQVNFVDVRVRGVEFAKEAQALKIVIPFRENFNRRGVETERYIDYIDLTVDAYHAPVTVETAVAETLYLKHSAENAVKTKLAVKDIFGDDPTWFLNDEKAKDPAQKGALVKWLKDHVNNATHHPYADSIVPPLAKVDLKKVYLTVNSKDTVVVNAPVNTLKHFVDGKDYKIYVTDSINDVIKFHYVINFTSKKIGATIETIPGYVKSDSVYVKGSSINVGSRVNPNYVYKIDDINLTQYYQIAKFDEKYTNDDLTAVFATPAKVTFDSGKTSPAHYECTPDQTGKLGVIEKTAKISWNGYNKESFKLAAAAAIEGEAKDSIYVTFWTKTPLTVVNSTLAGEGSVGHTSSHNLFEELKISGIVSPGTNLINCGSLKENSILNYFVEATPDYGLKKTTDGFEGPTVSDWKDWSCTVNGETYPIDQMKALFVSEPKWSDTGSVYHQTEYVLNFREHSAPATIVFTIPCTWDYAIGKLEFDMIFTLTVK